MRNCLNLGCGDTPPNMYKTREWINIDIQGPYVDLKCNLHSMPFKDNSIKEIHCFHVLEHIDRVKYKLVLAEAYRVLEPEGLFLLEVPDFEVVIGKLWREYTGGRRDRERIRLHKIVINGKTEKPGMAHLMGFEEDLLRDNLKEVGFTKSIKRIKDNYPTASHFRKCDVLCLSITK